MFEEKYGFFMYKKFYDFCFMEKDGKINTAPLPLIKVKWAVC
jgi:hypothetical protein